MSGEGYANLAAALLSFFGGKSRARREDRRAKRRADREDKRFASEMELRRSELESRNKQNEGNRAFQRTRLDRMYPEKTFSSQLMRNIGGMFGIQSPEDRYKSAQAGQLEANTDYTSKSGDYLAKITEMLGAGRTPPYLPTGMPGMRRTKQPRRNKASSSKPVNTRPTSVDRETFYSSAAEKIAESVMMQARKKGIPFSKDGLNLNYVFEQYRGLLEKISGTRMSEEDKAKIIRLLGGYMDEDGQNVPGAFDRILLSPASGGAR